MTIILSSDTTAIISLTEKDIEMMKGGGIAAVMLQNTVLVKNVLVMHNEDAAKIAERIENELGIEVTDDMKAALVKPSDV